MRKYDAILLDLDGTIMDSGPGIMKSAQYALDHFGFSNEPEETLRRFVGPSLVDSFMGIYGLSETEAKKATEYYREVYPVSGIFDAEVYEGMRETLERLADSGRKLLLVTSKPHVFAERILEHFGLAQLFSYQTGPELDDHNSEKSRLIDKAVREMKLDKAHVLMVGDRHFDIDGAKKSGVDSLGVTYGYGSLKELRDAGADYIAHSPAEILKYAEL